MWNREDARALVARHVDKGWSLPWELVAAQQEDGDAA